LATQYCTQKAHAKIDLEHMNFDYRKNLIVLEISSYNPLIICLEEVDEKDILSLKLCWILRNME